MIDTNIDPLPGKDTHYSLSDLVGLTAFSPFFIVKFADF